MQILFVGDGERDAVTVPALVDNILGSACQVESNSWREIRAGGYWRKTLFAILSAQSRGLDGVVATLDADKEKKGKRLAQMRKGRDTHRASNTPLPTALGEAVPHGEAWLPQDPIAVREGMNENVSRLIGNQPSHKEDIHPADSVPL